MSIPLDDPDDDAFTGDATLWILRIGLVLAVLLGTYILVVNL